MQSHNTLQSLSLERQVASGNPLCLQARNCWSQFNQQSVQGSLPKAVREKPSPSTKAHTADNANLDVIM
jgi:hypothetical protein